MLEQPASRPRTPMSGRVSVSGHHSLSRCLQGTEHVPGALLAAGETAEQEGQGLALREADGNKEPGKL